MSFSISGALREIASTRDPRRGRRADARFERGLSGAAQLAHSGGGECGDERDSDRQPDAFTPTERSEPTAAGAAENLVAYEGTAAPAAGVESARIGV
jgi:hypothetical protein